MAYYPEYQEMVYDIIGAAMKVHSILNFGLLEAVYQEALSYELTKQGIPNKREQTIDIYYGNHLLDKKYQADIVADDTIIIELKAVKRILPEHRAQLCNYLRLTKKPLGLLINFGQPWLHGERWAQDLETNECFRVDINMERIQEDIDIDFETAVE